MDKRKPLSKKIRFEVLKRDKFTCQYCGRMTPDVILEVDHIKPVAEGGKDDLLNLITSCRDCNRGKGKRRLDDLSEAKKQQKLIKDLADKNEQLEMLLKWRDEMAEIKNKEIDAVCVAFNVSVDGKVSVNDNGKKQVKKLLMEYPIEEILNAVDISISTYYKGTDESAEKAFDKIGGICNNRRRHKNGDMTMYYYNYLKKCCICNFRYCNEKFLKELVFEHIHNDDDFQKAKLLLSKSSGWLGFVNRLEEM